MTRRKGFSGTSRTGPDAKNVRDYVTPSQVNNLIRLARQSGRHGKRNAALIGIAYRHGLRVSEVCTLRWSDVDWDERTLTVRRAKDGISGVHPLFGADLRALRPLMRSSEGPWIFTTERGGPMTPAGVRDMLRRLTDGDVHPYMLRHGCGYKLVNDGTDMRLIQGFLGHRSPVSTLRYTAVDERRFRGLF